MTDNNEGGLGATIALQNDRLGKLESRFNNMAEAFDNYEESRDTRGSVVNGRLAALEAHPVVATPPDRAELFTALVAAQLEIRNADQNVDNEFTKKKYADLASVMDAVREPLAKNGLAIIQLTEDPGQGMLGIRTMLVHTSGQTVSDHITMQPEKFTPQGVGSCRTYMRRYAVLAICAIAGAVDDDAEGASKDPEDYERISHEEIDAILAKADDLFGDKADFVIQQMVEKTFDVTHVSQIKAGEADLAITRLKNTARREKAAAKKGADDKPSPKPPEREPGEDDG